MSDLTVFNFSENSEQDTGQLEDIVLLNQSVEYFPLSGLFFWKTKRPDNHFASNRAKSTWHSRYAGKVAGNKNSIGYVDLTISFQGKRSHFLGHRAAYAITFGRFPDEDVDHINGDRSDNKWVNLREVTREVNQRNKSMTSKNTSGHTGVSFSKAMGAWHAYINTAKSERKTIGYFKTKEEAAVERMRFIENNPQLEYTQRHGTVKAYPREVWLEAYALEF